MLVSLQFVGFTMIELLRCRCILVETAPRLTWGCWVRSGATADFDLGDYASHDNGGAYEESASLSCSNLA